MTSARLASKEKIYFRCKSRLLASLNQSVWAPTYLPLLVDDGHCILQFDVVEQTGQENVGHANQTVVLLLVEEGVGTFEIGPHHLGYRGRSTDVVYTENLTLCKAGLLSAGLFT